MMKMTSSSYSKKTPPTMSVAAIARTPLVDSSVWGVANKLRQQPSTNQNRPQPSTNQNQPKPSTNQKQPPSLADHRYQQQCRGQIEFLLADAVVVGSAHSAPIGRNRRPIGSSSHDPIVLIDAAAAAAADSPAAAEISPIFSLASPTNHQIFDDLIKNPINFFTEYETACEPISPATVPIPIPPRAAATLYHHQSSFDFTPPRIDFPLYTAANGNYSSPGPNNSSYLSPGPNNFNNYYYPIDSDTSSSSSPNPVWQDQFLNINELLPQHANFAAFNDPIFGQSSASSSFDDLLLSIVHEQQQQQENRHHVTDGVVDQSTPPNLRKSFDDHVTSPPTLYGGHVIFDEGEERGGPVGHTSIEGGGVGVGGGSSPASSHSSTNDQSYFAGTPRSITIRERAGAEIKKRPTLNNNHTCGGGFDQSAAATTLMTENFKNQQEILEEIYRECEKHVKICRPEAEIDQSAETCAAIIYEPIVHLDLDEESSSTSPSITNNDVTTRPPATATIFPLVERSSEVTSRDYDQPPIKKQRGNQQHQQRYEDSIISSSSYSPVIADWLSEDDDEEMNDIQQKNDGDDDTLLVDDENEFRKRRQNRKAASKYRTKRKIERISIESERTQLEAENRRLRSIVDDRQREIDYLRNFLDEIRASKSKMGRN